MESLIERRLERVVRERMDEAPVLLLEGSRGVGKSVLLRSVAASTDASVVDLDRPEFLQLARTAPSAVTDEDLPVLIDEYQKAPEILDSIKARLNRGTRPGMFLLAGSSSFDSLPRNAQALTGRIHRLPVHPLTQTELDGTQNHFVAQAFEGDIEHSTKPGTSTRLDYVARVLRGGMPLAVAAPTDSARTRWFAAHLRQSLERDAGELRRLGRKAELPRVLTRAVGQTGGILNVTKVAQGLDLSRDTVSTYVALLEALFLVSLLPAWGSTVSSRSTTAPKLHVVDSGIGGSLLRLSREKLESRDPSELTEFGHLLESFVVQEVLRQVTWLDEPVTAGHWRTRDETEVDLVLERYDGTVVAIEVKSGDHVDPRHLGPLRALRDRLGPAFAAGVVFHLGAVGLQMDDRIHSVPVERLWT